MTRVWKHETARVLADVSAELGVVNVDPNRIPCGMRIQQLRIQRSMGSASGDTVDRVTREFERLILFSFCWYLPLAVVDADRSPVLGCPEQVTHKERICSELLVYISRHREFVRTFAVTHNAASDASTVGPQRPADRRARK